MMALFGTGDKNLKLLGELFHTEVYHIEGGIGVDTTDAIVLERLNRVLSLLLELHHKNIVFNERDIVYIVNLVAIETDEAILDLFLTRKEIIKTFAGKPVFAKTITQKKYLDAIEQNTITLSIGPAGTGKTYLAVLYGLRKLKEGVVKQIVLTRPAVEAGENLGFLPGDLKEKIDPYLRPLYDAMYEIFGVKQTDDLIEKGIIEIAPLAYMRGRTLENAYVILDEAQNTTVGQMKLFLTRLGFGSKMIVTGDITQSDLPKKVESGLIKAANILREIPGIEIIYFDKIDVVRHPLVQTILKRFEDAED
ncbi:MAG: PhoH family protein [Bacillus subtilis]|nr:PhoH family protein [Bacillus subtilis]